MVVTLEAQCCSQCTHSVLDFDEHPCNICRYDSTTMTLSHFKKVRCYEIPSDTPDLSELLES